jgi:hypothetical protein
MSWRERQQHPRLARRSDGLLRDDDQKQPVVASGVPDRHRVGHVPHQEQDAQSSDERLSSDPVHLESRGIGCRLGDEGQPATDVEAEYHGQGHPGQPESGTMLVH